MQLVRLFSSLIDVRFDEVRDEQIPDDDQCERGVPGMRRNFDRGLVNMSLIPVELVLDAHATIGESPTWCAVQGVLFWIGVKAPALHRFNPSDGSDHQWTLPNETGDLAITRPATVLSWDCDRAVAFDVASGGLTPVAAPPYDPKTHRFNESGCDPTGRLWLGTQTV